MSEDGRKRGCLPTVAAVFLVPLALGLLVAARSADPSYLQPLLLELGAGTGLFAALQLFVFRPLRLGAVVTLLFAGGGLLLWAGSQSDPYWSSLAITTGVGIALFVALEQLFVGTGRRLGVLEEHVRSVAFRQQRGSALWREQLLGLGARVEVDAPVAEAAGWEIEGFYDEDTCWVELSREQTRICAFPREYPDQAVVFTGTAVKTTHRGERTRALTAAQCRAILGPDTSAEIEDAARWLNGVRCGELFYNAAKVLTERRNYDKALEHLAEAVKARPPYREEAKNDSSLEALRSARWSEFEAIITRADATETTPD